MNVRFRDSFARDLKAISDEGLLRRIRTAIERVEGAATLRDIPNLERLETKGKYYRLRVGEFRLGLVFEDGSMTFVRCLNRKEIYQYFP